MWGVSEGLGKETFWVENVMRERLRRVEVDGYKTGRLVLNKLSVIMDKADLLADFRKDRSELVIYPSIWISVVQWRF